MAVKELVQLKRKEDGAYLTFARTDKPVNVLDEACMAQLEACVAELESETPKILVLQSKIAGCFIAGADIHAIAAVEDIQAGRVLVQRGQDLFRRIEMLSSVSIAVVDGVCLGGGLELALACDYIIAVDDEKTRLALPEIKLGIHPGFGGCVRLPKRLGWPAAVQMILSGRSLSAKQAKRQGLAAVLCHAEQLDAAVNMLAGRGKAQHTHKKPWWFALWPVRQVFFALAEKKMRERFPNLDIEQAYPALLATLQLLRKISSVSDAEAYRFEAESIAYLATTTTCKHLIRVFFLGEALKHQDAVKKGKKEADKIQQTAVYGAGVMGSGIAWVASKTGATDLHDVAPAALSRGLQAVAKYVRRGDVRSARRLQRIRPSLDDSGLASVDVVLEAVLEELPVKQELWQKVEAQVAKSTLLLSNTSSLSVSAQQAELSHPGRLAGLHFFNPAAKMPLVEVIAGEKTTKKTIQTVAALAARWGKYPVVVADRPGFLVNRCLMPMMSAALGLLDAGQSPERIDAALKSFGMPMGAIELADRVGLDICLHVGEHLSEALGGGEKSQFAMPAWFSVMVKDGLLGEKTGAGFYHYQKGKVQAVNEALGSYVAIKPHSSKEFDANMGGDDVDVLMHADAIVQACLIPMLVEALACLEESVVEKAIDLDAALVFGVGFPPFRGGLLRYFATLDRPTLRQSIADLGYVLPNNLDVLNDFA